MYVLVFVLLLGDEFNVHTLPIIFPDYKTCEALRMENISALEESKPEGASHISQCVNMNSSHAAAPLEAALLRAENESDSSPQDDPHDHMWYER